MLNQNIYNKITTVGKDLVATAKYLSAKYGVPIVNQRISVTPIAQIAAATHADSYVSVAQTLDKAAKAIGGKSHRRIVYRRLFRAGAKRHVTFG